MPIRRTEGRTSDDLFSVAAKKAHPTEITVPPTTAPPTASVPSLRYLLPNDLSGALSQLDRGEIDSLLAALIDEVMRRGGLTPAVKATLLEATGGGSEVVKARRSVPSPPDRHQEPKAEGGPPLTVGQTNAVCAAFMAGVKPSTIARQFGISQAAVRKALATDARLRKP